METFSTLLALCEWNRPVTGGFPSQRPVTRKFNVFFDLPEKTAEQTIETPVRWDAIGIIMTSLWCIVTQQCVFTSQTNSGYITYQMTSLQPSDATYYFVISANDGAITVAHSLASDERMTTEYRVGDQKDGFIIILGCFNHLQKDNSGDWTA